MLGLYDARDRVKQTLYEVSGVSDIVRGQVDPREKATQSRLKAQFATARLDTRRRAVERVARDAARIQIELMAELYGPDTLREQSGFDLLPEAAEYDDAVKEQIWGQVVELLEDDKIRGFRIDVETDSTVEMDAGQTQESRTEFLQSAGNFLNNALPIAQQMPEMVKPISEMLLFTVRSYKAGRSLESAFEEAATKLQKKVEQAEQQPQQQDPEAAAKAQEAQQRMQVEGAKGQAQIQLLQQKGQIEGQKGQLQIQTIQQKAQLDAQGGAVAVADGSQAGQLDVAMSEQQLEQAAAQHELELEKIRVQIATDEATKGGAVMSISVPVIAGTILAVAGDVGVPSDAAAGAGCGGACPGRDPACLNSR